MTPRRLVALGIVTTAVAGALGYVVIGDSGLILAVLLIQFWVFVVVAWMWRDLRDRGVARDGKRGGDTAHSLSAPTEAGFSEVPERLDRLNDRLQEHDEMIAHLQRDAVRQLQVAQEAATARLMKQVDGLHEQVGRTKQQLAADILHERKQTVTMLGRVARKDFQQLEALAALYHDVRPVRAFPRTRSWVAAPDLLHWLFDFVRRERPSTVVECGSGVSTIVMAYAMREVDNGIVTALEHDEHWFRTTSELVDEHGLGAWIDLRLAPLEPIELDGESWPWYELAQLPEDAIDLLLVDGPPGATREHARFPALPVLFDRIRPEGVVILDDHERSEEREVAERWRSQFPELSIELLPHEKGTALLRKLD